MKYLIIPQLETQQEYIKLGNAVINRSDMSYVNYHVDNWYPKAAHVHIYVVDNNHPALD